MRLNGWFRLGIVLSALYGVLVTFIAYDSIPKQEHLQNTWFSEAADVIAKEISKAENTEIQSYQVCEELLKDGDAANIAWLEKVASAPTENQRKFSAAVARVNEKNKALIASLPSRQREHWMLSFAWWLGGTLLLFSLGWTVRWVYRGFRHYSLTPLSSGTLLPRAPYVKR